jgi:hypothetical protein
MAQQLPNFKSSVSSKATRKSYQGYSGGYIVDCTCKPNYFMNIVFTTANEGAEHFKSWKAAKNTSALLNRGNICHCP